MRATSAVSRPGSRYYAAAQLGFTLQFTGPVAAIVWLPVGVGIAGLYIGGLELWPGVLLGDMLADNAGQIPLAADVAQTVGNVLEVVVAVLILRYWSTGAVLRRRSRRWQRRRWPSRRVSRSAPPSAASPSALPA